MYCFIMQPVNDFLASQLGFILEKSIMDSKYDFYIFVLSTKAHLFTAKEEIYVLFSVAKKHQ